MTTTITEFPITGFSIADLALVAPAAGQSLEVGGATSGRVDIDALATYVRAGVTWDTVASTAPTTLAGYGITDIGIGTTVQAWNARLDNVAALSATSGGIKKTGTNTFGTFTLTAQGETLIAASTQAAARTAIGATTVGGNLFTLPNPSALTFPRMNADNTVTPRTFAQVRGDLDLSVGEIIALTPINDYFLFPGFESSSFLRKIGHKLWRINYVIGRSTIPSLITAFSWTGPTPTAVTSSTQVSNTGDIYRATVRVTQTIDFNRFLGASTDFVVSGYIDFPVE